MGEVPSWDEVHGWHEFDGGESIGGPDYCAICGCHRLDHATQEQYEEMKELTSRIQAAIFDFLMRANRKPTPEMVSDAIYGACSEFCNVVSVKVDPDTLTSECLIEVPADLGRRLALLPPKRLPADIVFNLSIEGPE
jgi:hypothetical protein